jgi:hypothetical protein
MNHQKHGIHGIIGSLDCSHFVWGNCPVAHHGQYQGKKEGLPLLWRHWQITTYLHGMLYLDIPEHLMTLVFGTAVFCCIPYVMVLFRVRFFILHWRRII